MEFGIYLRPAKTYENMLEYAKLAEKLNFQGAYINDHVHGFGDNTQDEYLEAWTVMAGIGLATTKLRIGQIVLFNSLRNPALLAKSIATLDIMINGRYELMLGAGWNAPEYESYDLMERGRGMPSAKERVDRFEEAIQIINSMLHNKVTNFDGEYWKIKDAPNVPQPIQNPMRITVGCGKPRMMNITAKYATGINIGGTYSNFKKLLDQFSLMAAKHDKSLSDYYISGFTSFHVTKSIEEAREIAKPIADRTETSIDEVLEENYIGDAETLIQKIRRAKDIGIDMTVAILPYNSPEEHKSIEYFHDNLLAQL